MTALLDERGLLRGFGKVFKDATGEELAKQSRKAQTERLKKLADISTRLNAVLDLESVIGVVTAEGRSLVRAHQAITEVNLEPGSPVRSVALSGYLRELKLYSDLPSIYQALADSNETVRLTHEQLQSHAKWPSIKDKIEFPLSFRGLLPTPILGPLGETLGVIQLSDKEEGDFDEEDEAILDQLAQMAAVAIENVRLYQVLRDADRKKDDFLALLAHELRNPLAPIRNGLQILKLAKDHIERDRLQAMMDRQLSHMVRLIDDLLDISRINRNKMELRCTRILLSDAIYSAVEAARPAIEAAGHQLTISIPKEPVYLDADLTRLAQVFSNLLNNSAKYTLAGGRIRLMAQVEADEVLIKVEDSGIGIPEDSLPLIFDMFSQVDRSIERSTGGLGIGLALVRGLVEMHGGAVSVASQGVNQGSTFTVRLPFPLNQEASVVVGANTDEPNSLPKRRVLVVDDNRDAAESMALVLRHLGNEVAVAFNGLEGIELARTFLPNLILMDIGMPQMNGFEATKHIREQDWGRDMIVIALTGWGQEGDRMQTRNAGCNGHLVKPVDLSDLQKLINELE